ncbi:hypothetical protein Pres01_53500 [Metapseudomonas resinovorans]|uniref:OmpA family protein n=1 Tax=Metapseudomonas resinovorans TaxID=53412 RepID=UPI0009844704|nr:OmpA family protein [Pseudomonas resinovorans]GLZ89299.1 hypothetical protein Pres01_53500 [Pseudomonas resinovorans]
MTLMLTRGLWLLAALLAMALLFVFPMLGWQRWSAVSVIALAAVLAWRWTGQRAEQLSRTLALDSEVPLPAAGFRQPVALVCGDGLPALFEAPEAGRYASRMTPQGCYLSVESLEHLPRRVQSILAHRPHWGGQLCVLFIVNPHEHSDGTELYGRIRTLRHQLALARRSGPALPLLLATYLQSDQGDGPWFCWEPGAQQADVLEGGARTDFGAWQMHTDDLQTSALRLRTGVMLNSIAGWLSEHVRAHLVAPEARSPVAVAVAGGVILVPALPGGVVGSLWQQWVCGRTALGELATPASSSSVLLPLPDPLLPLLRLKAQNIPLRRAGIIALWLFVAAMLTAFASSAWHNHQWARQASDDLQRYLAIPEAQQREQPEFAEREAAMSALRSHAVRLDGYYRHGEPLWLGSGLYQGERLRNELLAVIAGYRVPDGAPAVATIPDPVRLDSLSLFAVGSATLKPESTRLLINILVGIKAQPGWLIVIAGHTDATGNAEHNLQLSHARASAVRDWMQRMGDIPDGCFAVQGFGASQPIASNDTEIGRAANRRVDIRLVPEMGACVSSIEAPGGKHQSHPAAVNL